MEFEFFAGVLPGDVGVGFIEADCEFGERTLFNDGAAAAVGFVEGFEFDARGGAGGGFAVERADRIV